MKYKKNLFLVFALFVLFSVFTLVPAFAFTDLEKQQMYEHGEYLFSIGSYTEALSIYQKILDDDPTFSDAVGAKAAVFHRWGDYETAIKYYDVAISLNSTNPILPK